MPPKRRSEKKGKDSEQTEEKEEDASKKEFQRKESDSWIFLLNDQILQHDANTENKPEICALKHPKSEKKALFMFTNEDKEVYEIKQFKEQFRSWFIGETVQHDGSLYITSPVDPVYLVLPYLINAEKSGKYMTLDQIVLDEEFEECRRLHNTTITDLELVTDYKGDDDFKAYKYNPEKTLSWLKLKTEQVIRALRSANVALSGARSAELIKSTRDNTTDDDEYLRYAFGIVSDYIPIEVSSKLQEYLGIPAVTEKRPTDSLNPPAKRAKLEEITPLEDYSKNVAQETKPKGKQTVAQKQLGKVDKKGMKSMMSFFSPKSK